LTRLSADVIAGLARYFICNTASGQFSTQCTNFAEKRFDHRKHKGHKVKEFGAGNLPQRAQRTQKSNRTISRKVYPEDCRRDAKARR